MTLAQKSDLWIKNEHHFSIPKSTKSHFGDMYFIKLLRASDLYNHKK